MIRDQYVSYCCDLAYFVSTKDNAKMLRHGWQFNKSLQRIRR
jgi:hypothetical protein